jgi:Tfp pilus assembly protein PilF
MSTAAVLRLVPQLAASVGRGDLDGARALMAPLQVEETPTVAGILAQAAVAQSPEEAVGIVAAGLAEVPSDGRLMQALSSANQWLAGRIDRRAFAASCLTHVIRELPPQEQAIATAQLTNPPPAQATPPPAPDPVAAPVASATERGIAHLLEGDPGEARDSLTAALGEDAEDARARLGLAMALEAQGDLERAGQHLDALAWAYPSDPAIALAAAAVRVRQGDLQGAASRYERVIDLPAARHAALLGLARCHLALGDPAAAYQRFQLVLQEWPKDVRGYTGAAVALWQLGRIREAQVAAQLGADTDPESSEALAVVDAVANGDASGFSFLRPPAR